MPVFTSVTDSATSGSSDVSEKRKNTSRLDSSSSMGNTRAASATVARCAPLMTYSSGAANRKPPPPPARAYSDRSASV